MCAHCTCIAGVGEVCSHIAAVLFAAEGNTLIRGSSVLHPCHVLGYLPNLNLFHLVRSLILTLKHRTKKGK